MSGLLDILLGIERRAACAFSDSIEVHASVARNTPDLLVFDHGSGVVLEPQNELTANWLQKHVRGAIVIRNHQVLVERPTWPGICRAALNEGIRLA